MQNIIKGFHFLLLFFILYAATGATQNSQKIRTQKENSVTVVENPKTPAPLEETASHPVLVEDLIIVELKSVELVQPVHKKQLLTYLRLANKELGLLINFGEVLLKKGIHRIINSPKSNFVSSEGSSDRGERA